MSQFADYETEDEEQLQYEYEIQCMENYPYSDDEDDASTIRRWENRSSTTPLKPFVDRYGSMRHRIKHTPPHTKPTAGKGKAQHKKD